MARRMDMSARSCPYRCFGCPVKLPEKDLTRHLSSDAASHLNLVTKALTVERSTKEFQREASACAIRRCEQADRDSVALCRQLQSLEMLYQLAANEVDESKLSSTVSKRGFEDMFGVDYDYDTTCRQLEAILQDQSDIKQKIEEIKTELDKAQEKEEEIDPLSMPQSGIFGYAASVAGYATPAQRRGFDLNPLSMMSPRTTAPYSKIDLWGWFSKRW